MNVMGMSGDNQMPYVLGHSETELKRLARQAEMIDPITRRALMKAGLIRGMRVLDVGSGVGDVAFIAAELVGEYGEVVGTDRSPEALAVAEHRKQQKGFLNVSFHQGDPAGMEFNLPFDAVVGRYVLMFQEHPTVLLNGVLRHAKPGALVAFHEPDWASAASSPACEIYDRCCQWIVEVVKASGAHDRMGAELPQVFAKAGLSQPEIHSAALEGQGEEAADAVELIAELTISLMGEMERYDVTTPGEIGPEDLRKRMMAEVLEKNAKITGRAEVVAWARVPVA